MTFNSSNISGAAMAAWITGNQGTPFYAASSTQGVGSDTVKAALYGNTPNSGSGGARDDTLAHNAYGGSGGQWVTGNEITGTGYTAGGASIGTTAVTCALSTGLVTFTSTTNPSWTTATFSGVYGALVYDNTVTNKYAFCWNYFGGAQQVTSGTFTVNWNASGIFTVTIS